MSENSFNGPVYVLVSDLRYNPETPEKVFMITRDQWFRTKRVNGPLLTERITEAQYLIKKRQIEWDQHRKWYSKKIMEKYNVGPGWEQNRWFVEQVRPIL
jgi:hypothetical protein